MGQTTLSARAGDAVSILFMSVVVIPPMIFLPDEWSATGCRNHILTEFPVFSPFEGKSSFSSVFVESNDKAARPSRVPCLSQLAASTTPGQGAESYRSGVCRRCGRACSTLSGKASPGHLRML